MSVLRLQFRGTVIQDGQTIEPDRLDRSADTLASRIVDAGFSRIALTTSRADTAVMGLAAAEKAGCEVLLMRPDLATLPDYWSAWAIDGVVDDSLVPHPCPTRGSGRSGFAVLLTTSGTTGRPKVAQHRLERLLGRIGVPSPGTRKAVWLLTYHPATFAGIQVILSCVVGGGDLLAVSNPTTATLVAAATVNAVSHISGTPTFWRAFIATLGSESVRVRPKRITLGGEIADQATLDLTRRTFDSAVITHIYASTEAGALFSVQDGREGFPRRWLDESIDGVALRVRNDVLEVRSPRAMERYVDARGRAPLTDDGWLTTNDMVEIRDERVLFRGRADSTINVGGAKVLPEEVESVLLAVPGVVDARVFGRANPITGAIVAADITLADGHDEQAVRQSVDDRARQVLAPYKVPRILTFSREVQLSRSGKKLRTVE